MKRVQPLTAVQMKEADEEMKRQNGEVGGICAMAYDFGDKLAMCAIAAYVLLEAAPPEILQQLFGVRADQLKARISAIVKKQNGN